MYVKIFEDILDSSVWDESLATRVVWLTMLIMADEEGVVRASISGIRRRASVNRQEVVDALQVLTQPDIESKDKDFGGRRVEMINGGFLVLNYKKYREIRTKKQLADAERQRRHRAKPRDTSPQSQPVTTNETEYETEYETENVVPKTIVKPKEKKETRNLPAKRDPRWVDDFMGDLSKEDWNQHRSRKEAVAAFQFFRWVSNTKHRMIFSPDRERIAIKLIENYGLVRVMFAIVGQRTHKDFNQQNGNTFLGWDNLFRVNKGFEAIEKCADHALAREASKKTVGNSLAKLQKDRGWYPSEADAELFETVGGKDNG